MNACSDVETNANCEYTTFFSNPYDTMNFVPLLGIRILIASSQRIFFKGVLHDGGLIDFYENSAPHFLMTNEPSVNHIHLTGQHL
jgi:hypothetical protein